MSNNDRSSPVIVQAVNADNCDEQIRIISIILPYFPIISLETVSVAGVMLSPGANYNPRRHLDPFGLYNHVKKTVKNNELLQVGLTLGDADGKFYIVWEFNFKGFDHENGIECVKFAELLMSSGLVCNSEKVTWVSFHSPYDFGYLLKMLTGQDELPHDLSDFLLLLRTFFGDDVYDVKHLMRHCNLGRHGGLDRVARILNVEPAAGNVHLAGENSLMTLNVFWKIKELCGGEPEMFGRLIYGLED